MNKKLKDFIDENRRSFDDDLPPAAAWNKIERAIDANRPAKKISIKTIYRWSAAAAVFFIATISIYLIVTKKTDNNNIVKTKQPATINGNGTDIGKMAPEFAAEAKKIFQSIEQQQQQLKAIASEHPELYSQFAQDLAALDSSYGILKTQAIQTPGREIIIRAMLQNLKLQAELLSKQLMIIQEFNNNKTSNNEKDDNSSI